jgi:pantoate--beta-alanine ligase
MELIRDPLAMQRWALDARDQGHTIAFVPTMGYLHDGHLSLMRIGRARADRLVASVFVNPLQFGEGEDLAVYPRDEDGDLAKCAAEGCNAVFLPQPETMYPPGFQTRLVTGALTTVLCGASRPGHFDGVVSVVLKLFNLVQPHVAVFGSKDFQQLQVIRRMVRDLAVPVEIIGAPIIREQGGLALSSRNAYLSAEERVQALVLNRSLALAERMFVGGERSPDVLMSAVREMIEAQSLADIDYVQLVDAEELRPLHGPIDGPALLALAVRFGRTRLIDNCVLAGD